MLFYVSPSIPFIFFAFIKGWPKLIKFLEKKASTQLSNRKININSVAMKSVITGLLISNVVFGPSPISLQFWFKNIKPAHFKTQNFHYSVYKVTEHHRTANEFFDIIPNEAIISSQQFLFPKLYKKRALIMFPDLESPVNDKVNAEYVLFDKTNNGLNKESPAYITQTKFDIVQKDKINWQLLKSKDNYFLYKRIKD